jgi:hypothetical protein
VAKKRKQRARKRGLVEKLYQRAVQRGVRGSSRGWFAVAVATWAFRQARKLTSREEKVVLRERLKPGETLVITHRPETRESLESGM